MHFRIPDKEIRKLIDRCRPTEPVMEATAFYMVQLTHDRFLTQGRSGGVPWVGKQVKKWGHDDGRAILTGATGELLGSFQGYGTDAGQAVCFSDAPHSRVHQLGTAGKGGTLPTIVPKRAKALFIPITDRAAHSERLSGSQAAAFRSGHGRGGHGSEDGSPVRAGVKHVGYKPGKSLGRIQFVPLVPGRLKDGRLQVRDGGGEWVDGTPDFIFLRKVDIAPRPMLPSSDGERGKIVQFFADALLHGRGGRP